jgi:hypothetical protein
MIIARLVMAVPVPGFIQALFLRRLARLAAQAFNAPAPKMPIWSHAHALQTFAIFTAKQSKRPRPNAGPQLFAQARTVGKLLRKLFRPRDHKELIRVAAWAYALLGMDLQAGPKNTVIIRRCYFSRHYTPSACRFMSQMDSGFFVGLGAGRLAFDQRLTQGALCCRARILKGGR